MKLAIYTIGMCVTAGVLGATLAGCSESRAHGTDYSIPDPRTVAAVTTGGVLVVMPAAVKEHWPEDYWEILRMVDEEPSEKPLSDGTRPAGVLADHTVIVHPGTIPYAGSPNGFASGLYDPAAREIHVGYKLPHTGPSAVVPALGHEIAHMHAYVRGLPDWWCQGHGSGCQAP